MSAAARVAREGTPPPRKNRQPCREVHHDVKDWIAHNREAFEWGEAGFAGDSTPATMPGRRRRGGLTGAIR